MILNWHVDENCPTCQGSGISRVTYSSDYRERNTRYELCPCVDRRVTPVCPVCSEPAKAQPLGKDIVVQFLYVPCGHKFPRIHL